MKKLNVLISGEESQEICKAFREKGHNAFSNDIKECSGGYPEWHIKKDVREIFNGSYTAFNQFWTEAGTVEPVTKWDLLIAHPPCERLTVAANKYYKPEYSKRFPNIHEERYKAIEFFMLYVNCDIPLKCIENPIGIMSTIYRKPDQIIQPYQFGHTERKSTCLWLTGLPNLTPTNIVEPDIIKHKSGKTDSRLHYDTLKLPAEERRKARSKTFSGIAKAMAEQWSKYILNA